MAIKVEITNPTLLNFHNQRELAYMWTKNQIDAELPSLQKSIPSIETFSVKVRAKGKAYQEASEPEEVTDIMTLELKHYLQEYEDFKSTHEKITLVIGNIKSTIAFLTPNPRQWTAQKALEADAPKLYVQTKESERICLECIAILNPLQSEIIDLNGKLFALINHPTTTWSIQRFCGIVANDGKPLSACTRLFNYISPYLVTPTIPKSKEIKMPATLAEMMATSTFGMSFTQTVAPEPPKQQEESPGSPRRFDLTLSDTAVPEEKDPLAASTVFELSSTDLRQAESPQ